MTQIKQKTDPDGMYFSRYPSHRLITGVVFFARQSCLILSSFVSIEPALQTSVHMTPLSTCFGVASFRIETLLIGGLEMDRNCSSLVF